MVGKFKNILIACVIFFIGSCSSEAFGQNQPLADSLIAYLETNQNLSDSLQFQVLKSISLNTSNPTQSIKYAKEALIIAEKQKNKNWVGDSYLLIGEGYKTQGKLAQALEAFHKAGKYYQAANNENGKAATFDYIATTYLVQKDYNKALFYYGEAIQLFVNNRDSLGLAISYQNKGDVFQKLNHSDSAIFYLTQSLNLFEKINYELGVAYCLGNISLVQAKQENFKLSETNFSEAIRILEKYGDSYAISDFYNQMAETYFKNKNTQKAFSYLNKSLALATKDGLKEQIRDASLKLSELYAQTEDYEKAYQFHTQYVAYRDSINNEEVIRKMADLRTEYEVSQKQAEIDLLTKQRQINKLIGLGLVFITVLLSILAFILYRTNRSKQETNKTLTSQKEKLEIQHHKLEALNNTKDRFFSIISHDLRGPVNAFNGISELIKHYIAKNEMAQLREVSEYIDKSARQLSTLLDNLLDWAVKQQGTFPFRQERIHLNPLLKENAEMFGVTAHSKKITFSVNLEDEIFIWADRNSLNTIIRNLVNNALKFTEAEGLVTISAYTQKEYAMINIIDTGIGIPENKLENLFDLKEKNLSSGTAGEKGLGIGLNLAYEFALMNKGTIIVNSEENAGTIFTVKLPLYQPYSNKGMNLSRKETSRKNEPAR